MQELAKASASDIGPKALGPKAVVVIGASTGGPGALAQILPKFPKNLQASIIVVQQMRPGFTRLVANHLNGLSELVVKEAERAHPLMTGTVLFAPGDCRVSIEQSEDPADHPFVLKVESVTASIERMRRRVDVAMTSAARLFGARAIGVILTGIGDDGRAGMTEIRECGGRSIAQDELSSVIFDMPRASIEAGVVDEVLPLWSISDRIIEIVGES